MQSPLPRTLPDLLEGASARFPALEALGEKTGTTFSFLTYRDLQQRVADLRAGLRAAGIAPGDRIALICDNCSHWVTIAFATHGVGAVLVPMYEAQAENDWEYILQDSGAKLALVRTTQIYERAQALRADLPGLERVLCLEAGPNAPADSSYRALIDAGSGSSQALQVIDPAQLATLIYTSGTTGKPKGVCLSHENICSNVRASCERYPFGPGDRSVAFLPWAHAFGQTAELYVLLWSGATLVINDEIPHLADNLARFHPTVLVAVPRIFNKIYASTLARVEAKPAAVKRLFFLGIAASQRLRAGSPRLGDRALHALCDRLFYQTIRRRMGGRLRFVISGSAALSPQVGAFIDALGVNVFEGYGMTEASPVVTSNFEGHRKLGSVGLPLNGVKLRIEPCEAAPEGQGEIVVSGPNVMLGYHGLSEESAQVLTDDGWLRTGDMGRIDEDGYLFLTGRIKEQYKLENGKYVVPSPLEEQLKLSPLIEQVMIYGDGRPYNVALVVVDRVALAKRLGREFSFEAAATASEVRALIEEELLQHASAMKSYERPRKFGLCPGEFTQENGLLTPSLKVKRPNVIRHYSQLIDSLYS